MASIDITINDPTLQAGEKFVERHRLLPSGGFSAWTDRTNAQFTITGLVEGRYEVEIAFVKANGEQCPSVFKYYDVVAPEPAYVCPTFSVEQEVAPSRLVISYTGGTGVSPCGYIVQYKTAIATAWTSVNYPTLPSSPFTVLLPLTADLQVRILSNTCAGSIICFDDDVLAPNPPVCNGINGFDYIITPIEQPMQGKRAYKIVLTATTQSTIPTTSATFIIKQGFTFSPAVPWTGTFPITGISATSFSVTFIVYHNFPGSSPTPPIYWTIIFTDACGKLHNIIADYP